MWSVFKQKIVRTWLVGLAFCCLAGANASAASDEKKLSRSKDYLITLSTEMGDMLIILSDKTLLHRANFVKLAREGFYNGLLFHRVIEGFMIQGGDPNSRNAKKGTALGSGGSGKRIPAEFVPELFHKKGVIAAARDNNPEKASSDCQFYIVQGKKWNEKELSAQLERAVRKPTVEQQKTYLEVGGVPHLDGNYTVFGEVIKGLEVLDKLAAVETDSRDRPLEDIRMTVKVEVWKKKKITKKFNYQY